MSYTYENEIKVLKEGDYEGVLGAYKTVSERTGVEYIRLEFKIRDDIEQEGKNRIIFDNIFQEKNEKGEPSGVYMKWKVNNILGAVLTDNEKAAKITFDTIEDVIKKINGSKVIAHVCVENNDYTKGEDVNKIKFYKTTKHPSQVLAEETNELEVSDDDLPF